MIERMRNICIGGKMNTLARASLFVSILLVGCGTTRDVAVTSYHVTRGVAVGSYRVATAPVHYALKRHGSQSSSAAPRTTNKETTQAKPKPLPSSHASASGGEFPTAKSVPGKPGYVFSPFDSSGRYVDVSGYGSGSKVKDPWTDKIFIVP